MDSPATLLTILTTLIGYMAVVAVIFKLFQIASELSEIKELLARGHSSPSSAKGEDSASSALGLDSVSYAESLLRSVKAQEETGGYRGPVNEDGFGDPYSGPRSRVTDPATTVGGARTKTVIRQADSAAVDDPWRERPRESARTATPTLEAQSTVWSEEKPTEPVGKWSREVQREKRGAAIETKTETKSETKSETKLDAQLDASVSAHAAENGSGDKTSSQLTALNSSVVKTSPERRRGASTPEWNSSLTVAAPVAATAVSTPAVSSPAVSNIVAPVAVPGPVAALEVEPANLPLQASLPLHTPPLYAPVPSVPAEAAAAPVVSASPAAVSLTASTPTPALPVPAVAAPTVPSLENAPTAADASPLASLVPNVMGNSASVSLPPENSTRVTQPRIWPPEPVNDEALPTFLPASDKTIDWNAPLD